MLRKADHPAGPEPVAAAALSAAAWRDLRERRIAYVGTPSSPSARLIWQREIELLQQAGRSVAVLSSHMLQDRKPGSLQLFARSIMIADPLAARALRPMVAHVECGLRFVAGWPEGSLAALRRRWPVRFVILPGDAVERQQLTEQYPGAWLAAEDWPAMVDPAALYRQLSIAAPATNAKPLSVAVYPGQAARKLRSTIQTALAKAGLDPACLLILPALAADPKAIEAGGGEVLLQCDEADGDPITPALSAIDAGVLPVRMGAAAAGDAIGLVVNAAALPLKLYALARDRRRLRQYYLQAAGQALDRFGTESFFARFDRGLFEPLPKALLAAADPLQKPQPCKVDLAVVGDFSHPGEVIEQLIAELHQLAVAGQRIALCPTAYPAGQPALQRGIEMLVRTGIAELAAAWQPVTARTARLIDPARTIPALAALRLPIEAKQFVAVELGSTPLGDRAAGLHLNLQQLYDRPVLWHAADRSVQARLALQVPTHRKLWQPVVEARPRAPALGRFVAGVVAYNVGDAKQALSALQPLASHKKLERRVMLLGTGLMLTAPELEPFDVLAMPGSDLAGFIARLDVLVITAPIEANHLPFQAVAQALASRVTVLADPATEPRLGAGPDYQMPADWPKILRALLRRTARQPVDPAAIDQVANAHRQRLGLRQHQRPAARPDKRILFITANGVGLGHITRLSAIARRLPAHYSPIFASMSQAVGILQPMGFPAELLTSYTGKKAEAWNAATTARLDHILDQQRPDALVLDASNPYPGVVQAAAARRNLQLIWIRRGMWRASQNNADFLTRAAYFDLIIEPGDIAAAFDETRGKLAASGCLKVPPIGLLDERELLERRAARTALGLDPDEPRSSVLVQLGSGTTRDLNRLLDRVFEVLGRIDGLEIVLAQWLNSTSENRGLWPNVKMLRGYPIPLYYRAFDFTLSAAGYNSFNDLLRFGVPTIFIANDAQVMDDQGARARYAQEAQAAFDIHEFELEPLEDCVRAIMQPNVQAYLADKARQLARPNGAKRAVRAITDLLEPAGCASAAGQAG